MKELFRHGDYTRVGFLQTLLEAEGIPTFVRNESTPTYMTGFPAAEPALCVVRDEDYDRAMSLLKLHLREEETPTDQEVTCPKCGESNPANFDVCWSCSAPLK